MPNSAWNSLFLLGSLNSLFLGLLLVNPKQEEKGKANRYLSVILFSWSFGFFYTWMIETGMYRSYPHLLLVGAPFTFLTGPCLYLYMEALLGRKGREEETSPLWKKHLLHFAPFYLNTVALFPLYLQSGTEKLRYWEELRGKDPLFTGMQVLQLLHLGVYLTVLFFRLRQYRKNLGQTESSLEGITLDWFRNLILLGFLGLGVYVVVFTVFRVRIGETMFVNRFTDLAVLVILHVLGYEALTQPAIRWRGYALPGLLTRMSGVSASILLASFWALWHFPLFLIPGYPLGALLEEPLRIVFYLLDFFPNTILYTMVFLNSGGSIPAAILFHWSGNFWGMAFETGQAAEGIALVLKANAVIVALLSSVSFEESQRTRRSGCTIVEVSSTDSPGSPKRTSKGAMKSLQGFPRRNTPI
jgi:membrane protease YdiL (CAAX protease family)